MGLLDDAIREHLDLKRRRGGDPAEIERAEREALGPVRRRGENTTPEDGDPLAAEPVGSAYDEPDDAVAPRGGAQAGDLVEEPPAPALEPDTASDAGRAFVQDDKPFEDDEPFTDEQPAASAPVDEADAPPPAHEPATRVMRAADIPTPADATAEYDVEQSFADEPEVEDAPDTQQGAPRSREPASATPDEDEDMLEETPEFLQDTPDHDRLWFEQRPPRDFDFDG